MTPYYEHAGVTIYHGDCRDVIEEWEGLRTHVFDVLVTDPPYGINFAGMPTKWQRRAGHEPQAWDEQPFENLRPLLNLAKASCVWGGNYYALPVSRGWLGWLKPDAPPSMASMELAWTSLDANARCIVHSISATNAERVGHPTQKPLAVMRWCLSHMPPGSIFDPFMGSGTTLVAAKQMGRPATGIEINEAYCEIAAKRLQQEALPLEVA